jgi:hypothetical protein
MVSEPYLCFAACLQVALQESAGVRLDQRVIANHLGVTLPVGFDASELVAHGVSNLRFEHDSNLWGIQPSIPGINEVLWSVNEQLECGFESISRFQDWEFEERLRVLAEEEKFPIIGFDYNSLFGPLVPGDEGHCAVVYRIHSASSGSSVEVYDPGPSRPGFQTVDSYALYRACRKKHGGIWFLSRTPTPLA